MFTGVTRLVRNGAYTNSRSRSPTAFRAVKGRGAEGRFAFATLARIFILAARCLRHARQLLITLPISQTLMAEARAAVFIPRRVRFGFVRFQTTAVSR